MPWRCLAGISPTPCLRAVDQSLLKPISLSPCALLFKQHASKSETLGSQTYIEGAALELISTTFLQQCIVKINLLLQKQWTVHWRCDKRSPALCGTISIAHSFLSPARILTTVSSLLDVCSRSVYQKPYSFTGCGHCFC